MIYFMYMWMALAGSSVGNSTVPDVEETAQCSLQCSCHVQTHTLSVMCASENNQVNNSAVSLNITHNDSSVQVYPCDINVNSSAMCGDKNMTECHYIEHLIVDEQALDCANLSKLVNLQSIKLMRTTATVFMDPPVNVTQEASYNYSDFKASEEHLLVNETRRDDDDNQTSIIASIGSRLSELHNLTRLDSAADAIGDLSAICTIQQANITALDLSHNRITDFPDAIGCLHNLQRLDVSYNLVESVDGLLTSPHLADVRYFNLSHNLVQTLPRGVFHLLTRLVHLDLSYNLLRSLESGTFACHMGNVEMLSLAGNQIVSLAKYTFTGLSSLQHLDLSHNQLDSVHGEPFIHANPNRDCHLYDLDTNNSNKLENTSTWTNFQTIDLSYNNIVMIDKTWFHSAISNIRVIMLGHNKIKHFPRYGLERLPRLERLSLDHNKLFWLDVGTFTSRTLKYINLSHNKLKKIISMTFLFLPDIQLVDLSHNELNFIYKVAFYKSCKHDQHFQVDLSHNYLTEDVTWALVTSFRHLTATQCVVDLIVRNNLLNGILGNAKHLYERHIRLMDATYFNVWDHVTIDLQENPLKCTCDLINDVTLLAETRRLFLGNMSNTHHLAFWDDIQCLSTQQTQKISVTEAMDTMMCSSLLQCPYECTCYFDKVTIVNCTRRSLVAIPYDLPPGVKKVYMSENYIMELEDGPYLNNITYLDLSANALIDIEPESLLRFAPTSTLLFHSNVLSQIPHTISRFEKSGHVTLRGNPISCDCENWWFVDWMANHTDTIVDFDNITCDNGKHIMEELDPAVVMSFCKSEASFARGRSVSVLYASLTAALCIGVLSLIIVTLVIHSRRRILPVLMNRLSWYRLNLEHETTKEKLMLWYSPLDEDWVTNNLLEPLRSNLPIHTLCPYHQCLIQDDNDDSDMISDNHECVVKSVQSSKCVVVVLSENFIATEWSSFEEWQHHEKPHFLFENQHTPIMFLSIEALKLTDYPNICDVIKRHTLYDISEMMWLESLLDNISSMVTSPENTMVTSAENTCDMDWTDDESLSLREDKY